MKSVFYSILLSFFVLSACPSQKPAESLPAEKPTLPVATAVVEKKLLYSKELREALYFAASLEREALRLISHNNSFDAPTLFLVLSYAFEVESGVKRASPIGMDCGRFRIDHEGEDFKVYKTCLKPANLIAIIHESSNHVQYSVDFKIKEVASIVGLSVTLTNADIQCQFQLKEKKLNSLSCEHWSYLLSTSDASATEIHLTQFSFKRDQAQQLKLVGGFFRDLIERKKIEVSVPLQGKIKLIEKEIEVKDDFAEKPKTNEAPHGEKSIEKEKSSEKDYQKWIKGESQDSTQGNTEGQNQIQEPGQNQSEIKNEEIPSQDQEVPVENGESKQSENAGGVPQPGSGRRGR